VTSIVRSLLSRAKYVLSSRLSQQTYWNLMVRLQPARAVTSRYPSLEKSLESGGSVVEMLKTLGVITPGAVVLQIGCGIGRVEFHLHKYVRLCYGIDIAASMLAQARSNVRADNVRFIHASQLANLSLPRLDLVYAVFVFQHLPRQKVIDYLGQSRAALGPGGKLVFQILVDETGTMPEPPRTHPYGLRYYRRSDLAALLATVGFRDVTFLSFPDANPDSGADGDLLVVASPVRQMT
jgi:SAM-dependent methyltransferase